MIRELCVKEFRVQLIHILEERRAEYGIITRCLRCRKLCKIINAPLAKLQYCSGYEARQNLGQEASQKVAELGGVSASNFQAVLPRLGIK
jgi:hypothetical protein